MTDAQLAWLQLNKAVAVKFYIGQEALESINEAILATTKTAKPAVKPKAKTEK